VFFFSSFLAFTMGCDDAMMMMKMMRAFVFFCSACLGEGVVMCADTVRFFQLGVLFALEGARANMKCCKACLYDT
jgi:hypothetical protein